MKTLSSAAIALAIVLFSGAALAQSNTAQAQQAYDDGAAYYVEGEYARAIVQFKKAFSLVENPVFLFNIALAEHKLGRADKAVDAAERALGYDALDDRTRSVAQGLVRGSTLSISARGVAEGMKSAAAVAQSESENTGEVGEGGIVGTAPPAESSFGAMGWAGVGLAAVGAGALVWGTILSIDLDDRYQRYNDPTRSNAAEAAELKESIEADRPLALGLLIGGGAIAALGATLIVLELGDDEEPVTLHVDPSPDRPSVSIRGQF